MTSRAKRRLALPLAAAFAFAALTFKPLYACDSKSCPSNPSSLEGVAANALPTYPEPTDEAAKRFAAARRRPEQVSSQTQAAAVRAAAP